MEQSSNSENADYPTYVGQYLIATPAMGDPRFAQTVIFLCAHDASGAMGLIVNRAKLGLVISDLLDHVGVDGQVRVADAPVLDGGPVDIDRGFVLHSADWFRDDQTLKVSDTLGLSTTKDALEALVGDQAPDRAMLAVGYAGWGPGQLEAEIADNAWLVAGGDDALVFGDDMNGKWTQALARIGVSPEQLSAFGGSA
ncbi:YqgE/AlgH family protein [uncultured Algimonas sp.]|uniref:YqgE/AlgH family protein n=1 Tax=uncultured Algimonas sp. TaxID=1547920 RepID=UPI00261ABAFA|nr:YqgE/AlgH family protein [uncultured Algimonas sp.]